MSDKLEVGQKRKWNNNDDVFVILYIGKDRVFCEYLKDNGNRIHKEFIEEFHYIVNTSSPYIEPEEIEIVEFITKSGDVKKETLEAFEAMGKHHFYRKIIRRYKVKVQNEN